MISEIKVSPSAEKHKLQVQHSILKQNELPSTFANKDSWDAWRHFRMYDHLQPILSIDPTASWLTIGDSGADAAYIRTYSTGRIVASSITRAALDFVAAQG